MGRLFVVCMCIRRSFKRVLWLLFLCNSVMQLWHNRRNHCWKRSEIFMSQSGQAIRSMVQP